MQAEKGTMDKRGMEKSVKQKNILNLANPEDAQRIGVWKMLCFSTGKELS